VLPGAGVEFGQLQRESAADGQEVDRRGDHVWESADLVRQQEMDLGLRSWRLRRSGAQVRKATDPLRERTIMPRSAQTAERAASRRLPRLSFAGDGRPGL
jgi:hypothetical protein